MADTIRDGLEDEQPDPPTAHALLRHLFLSEQALEAEPFLEPALRFMERQVSASSAAPFLEKLAEKLREGPVKVESRVVCGHPFREIVRRYEDGGHDLIVMATHGHAGFKHLLLGSVTEKVLRRSPGPVLTVPVGKP